MLYSIVPCFRCQRDVWRLGKVNYEDGTPPLIDYSCFYDGRMIYIPATPERLAALRGE